MVTRQSRQSSPPIAGPSILHTHAPCPSPRRPTASPAPRPRWAGAASRASWTPRGGSVFHHRRFKSASAVGTDGPWMADRRSICKHSRVPTCCSRSFTSFSFFALSGLCSAGPFCSSSAAMNLCSCVLCRGVGWQTCQLTETGAYIPLEHSTSSQARGVDALPKPITPCQHPTHQSLHPSNLSNSAQSTHPSASAAPITIPSRPAALRDDEEEAPEEHDDISRRIGSGIDGPPTLLPAPAPARIIALRESCRSAILSAASLPL